jgi:hypothetical protein
MAYFEVAFKHLSGKVEKVWATSVMIVCIPDEISTGYQQNTSLENYPTSTTLLGKLDNKPIMTESLKLPKRSNLWNTPLRYSRIGALDSSTATVISLLILSFQASWVLFFKTLHIQTNVVLRIFHVLYSSYIALSIICRYY